jgi:hypothetical protein
LAKKDLGAAITPEGLARSRNHPYDAKSRCAHDCRRVRSLRHGHCAEPCSRCICCDVGAKRPRAELIQLLTEQRQALAASCEGYDRGSEWEAARLATTIYTLVHDGGSITSLLTQLGLRSSLRFVSTGRYEPPPNMQVSSTSPPLVGFRGDAGGMKFVPQFCIGGNKPPSKLIQFPTWWAKENVFHEVGGTELTRRRLVFALRHQDGGSHVGELTDPSYVRLKAGAGFLGNAADGSTRTMIEAATATMRQVAWEVTETLKQLGEVT